MWRILLVGIDGSLYLIVRCLFQFRYLNFVGIAGYAPASFHGLVDDEVKSDGSSIDDVMALGHPLSRECAMADVLGQPPVVAESLQAHTPPDPLAEALARA